MPGYRKSEIKSLIGIFKEVAAKLNKENIIVIPKHFNTDEIKALYGDLGGFTVSRDAHQSLLDAEFAYVCSGTATLEAAIIGTQLVLCYKAKAIDYFIAKRFVKLKFAGLANIIFDFCALPPLHKEFLQDEVSVKNLLSEYEYIDKRVFLNALWS